MPHTACNYYLDTALMARFKKKRILKTGFFILLDLWEMYL